MKKKRSLFFPCLIIMMLMLLMWVSSSCCTQKVTPPSVDHCDSIQIVIKDRIVHDTVPFYIPAEPTSSVTPDDSSHLETSFAMSDAWIKNGLLHHMLKNKEQTIEIPHETIVTDTTTTHSSQTTTIQPPQYIEVEKDLSWWQKICIKYFPWTLAGLLLSLGWIFRKPIGIVLSKLI